MCEWFITTFFSTPNQIAILSSFVSALIIVLINKWIVDSREKKKHLISKLEEISKLTSEYSLRGMHYVQNGINLPDEEKNRFNPIQSLESVISTLSEIDALLSLNFSKQSFFILNEHVLALKKHREELVSQTNIFKLNVVSEKHSKMVFLIRTGLRGLMSDNGYKTT